MEIVWWAQGLNWIIWLSPVWVMFSVSGFTAARDIKDDLALFGFLKQNADNISIIIKEHQHGREDLVDEHMNFLERNNKDIHVACDKMYALAKPYAHRRWVNMVSEIRYLLAKRRILKEAI